MTATAGISAADAAHPEVRYLVDDETLGLRWLPAESARAIVVFTGIRHGIQGMPENELIGSASSGGENNVLFVSDKARTWYSHAALCDRIVSEIETWAAAQGITWMAALGNSMGGYGALRFADRLPFRIVSAFAPQISMHPDVMDEPRWTEFRPAFGPDLPRSVAASVARAKGQIFVTYGSGSKEDCAQVALLPRQENVHVSALPGSTHPVLKDLKEAGVMRALLAAHWAGDRAEVERLLEGFQAPPVEPGMFRGLLRAVRQQWAG